MWSRKPKRLREGTLAERPWPIALASIASAAERCQLTVKSDGKLYQVAFINGLVVGAVSPAPADAVQRIALTQKLLAPSAVAAAVRIMGRADDVEKFVDAAGLVGEGQVRFKRRVLVQRAARTFALERGDYVVEDRITIPTVANSDVDVRAVIYHGMRLHLSETRLSMHLRALGSRFILYPESAPYLEKFDLDAEAEPVIAALRGSTSVAELEATHRDLDPRLVHAVLGALATCNVITPIAPREDSSSGFTLARGTRRNIEPQPFEGEATTARPSPLTVQQIQHLIASRFAMLEGGVDLFAFLGVPFGAPIDHVRNAYLEIARYLRPERLAERGLPDLDEARAVFAQAAIALTTLTDERRRREYIASIRRGRPS